MRPVTISGIPVGDGYPTRVVAELGVNHGGSLKTAYRLIEMAQDAGCDFVKLQARTPELAVPESEWHEIRPTPFGPMPKLEYRKRVEFTEEQYEQLDAYCHGLGIPWFVSVWDLPSVDRMERVGCPAYKIPSARLHDKDLLAKVAWMAHPIILSTGMSTWEDVVEAVETIHGVSDGLPDLIVMQCTSAYPAQAAHSDLRVIPQYKRAFCAPAGFSSHKIGKLTCLLAVAVGANMVERHITEDRRARGSDHKLSTEADELAELVREIRYVESCLGDGQKHCWPEERLERQRLRGAK